MRRILNSVNEIGNSGKEGNDVNSTNHERQEQNETRSIAEVVGSVSNLTQQELYCRFRIPQDNGTQSERGVTSSNATNVELLSQHLIQATTMAMGTARQPTPYTRKNQQCTARTTSAVPSRVVAISTIK